jgi:hypothetical protein
MELGIVIEVKFEHNKKVLFDKNVNDAFVGSVTEVNDVQALNVEPRIIDTESGIVTEVNAVH